jgi:hypothetical protein
MRHILRDATSSLLRMTTSPQGFLNKQKQEWPHGEERVLTRVSNHVPRNHPSRRGEDAAPQDEDLPNRSAARAYRVEPFAKPIILCERKLMGIAQLMLRRHCEPTGRRKAPPDDGLREAIQRPLTARERGLLPPSLKLRRTGRRGIYRWAAEGQTRRVRSGKHPLAASIPGLDPGCVKTSCLL